ncbi:hypothetical protein PRVXH_002614 [Proteinivorax hydrogeniformans]|uniref:DNA mismatch repair proteins mutS family domain-containing protein n=1 Tax=Proteinivorax hydrogeniformans TaxID=1826727 RepID=A0AAU8HTS1_9FIRM
MDFFSGNAYEGIGFEQVWLQLEPHSPYGVKRKKGICPSINRKKLKREYTLVQQVIDSQKKDAKVFSYISDGLYRLKDITGIVHKAQREVALLDEEFFRLKSWLMTVNELETNLKQFCWRRPKNLELEPLVALIKMLSLDSGGPSFYLSDSYSPKLKELRQQVKRINRSLTRYLSGKKDKLEEKYGIKFNYKDSVSVNKFEIELVEDLEKDDNLMYYAESYSEVEFRIRPDETIRKLQNELLNAKEQLDGEEYQVRRKLTKKVNLFSPSIIENCNKLGHLDWLITKSIYAKEIGGGAPTLVKDEKVDLVNAKNPILESHLLQKNRKMTPITATFTNGVTVITGANMGGKSVTLKTVGLLIAMAQYGLLVPAEKFEFSPKKFIYYSQLDGQSLDEGLSTFGAEIEGIKKVIAYRNRRGLYLIDELARGTNPHEGGALALAIANYLNKGNSTVLLTSHFEEIVKGDFNHLRIIGLDNLTSEDLKKHLMEQKNGLSTIHSVMDYNLKPLKETGIPKDGLKIAALLGLPKEIVHSAECMLESRKEEGTHGKADS